MKVHCVHGERTARASRTRKARKRIAAAQRVRYEVIRERVFLETPGPSRRITQLWPEIRILRQNMGSPPPRRLRLKR